MLAQAGGQAAYFFGCVVAAQDRNALGVEIWTSIHNLVVLIVFLVFMVFVGFVSVPVFGLFLVAVIALVVPIAGK
jgi:hypothetical protein